MKLLAHPFDNYRLGDFLLEGLSSDAAAFTGAAAFAQRSGIGYLASLLRDFSQKRPFQLTVGVDLLGTSKEALELLLESAGPAARLFVFHNPNATFHPKAFRFEYQDRWEVYSGSGNLTRGGMFGNYEAGLVISLAKKARTDSLLNQRFDAEFTRWSDASSPVVKTLNERTIRELVDCRLVVTEKVIQATRKAAREAAGSPKRKTPMFGAMPVPAPPKLPPMPQGSSGSGDRSGASGVRKPASGQARLPPIHFVITAQKTDVGHGQTTPGTEERAAEYFIPLVAMREQAEFWKWPSDFVDDPAWTKKLDADGHGRMHRRKVPFYVEGEFEWVTMIYNPDKGDFRLFNERLRSSGKIGDVLRVSLTGSPSNPLYVAEFIDPLMPEYETVVSRAATPVRNSPKKYGYY